MSLGEAQKPFAGVKKVLFVWGGWFLKQLFNFWVSNYEEAESSTFFTNGGGTSKGMAYPWNGVKKAVVCWGSLALFRNKC